MIRCDECLIRQCLPVIDTCDCRCHGEAAIRDGRLYRAVISGSRHAKYKHVDTIRSVMRECPAGTIFAHGWANGVDSFADSIASTWYQVERWPVDWNAARRILGKRWKLAGPLRNGWMLHAAPTDIMIGLPLPDSTGTADCIKQARIAGIPVRVVELKA